ncbi:hypothetical protein GOV10_01440 [Candidatus Woesearchaeota archaeon]|nr:hypothetical protein [Candidatus Woesearchaeota archaeon]
MRQDVMFYLGLFTLVLFAFAVLLPGNPLTGNAVLQTESCAGLGCSELCDLNDDCGTGMICCPSAWKDDMGEMVGLCDYPNNCGVIAEYSLEGELEEFVLVRNEKPQAIANIAFETFWLPFLIVALICIAIIYSARKQKL